MIVEKSSSQRLEHPGAAVCRRASPEPDHDLGDADVERRRDHQAQAVCRRAERVEPPAGKSAQANRRRQLDDGDAVASRVRRSDLLTGRPDRVDGDPGEAGRDCGVDGAVAAVGDRNQLDVRIARVST